MLTPRFASRGSAVVLPAFAMVVLAWLALPVSQAQAAAAAAEAEKADDHEKETDSHAKSAGEHGSDHAAAEGGTGPMDFQVDLALWTGVVFVVMFLILSKFAWGPISAGLDKREHDVAEHIAAAERSNLDAKRLLSEYEVKLAKAHEETRAILEEARRDAEHTQQEILAKAKADAEQEVARGKREIETATGHALAELSKASANLAVDLAGKIVQQRLSASDHSKLIEEALAGFPKGDPSSN